MLKDRNAYRKWTHAEEAAERAIRAEWGLVSDICYVVRDDIGWHDIYHGVFMLAVDRWVKPANWD